MSDLPVKPQSVTRLGKDDRPKLGEWYWIKEKDEKGNAEDTWLACVTHIASNHVTFTTNEFNDYGGSTRIRNEDLPDLKPEPNWRAVFDGKLQAKQLELQAAVMALQDACLHVDLIPAEGKEDEPVSMLPARVGPNPIDPKAVRRRLIRFRDKSLPASQKVVEGLTKDLVNLQQCLFLPDRARFNWLKDKAAELDDRLFALQLYGGIGEQLKTLATGAPAEPATPITARQMLRYMDEETLWNLEYGGADFSNLRDFDEWIAKPENYTRLLPEPRCVVAFRVRRHDKNYPTPGNILGWFSLLGQIEADKFTYLFIRNGENLYRLTVEVDFSPRLLPLRDEFHKPFIEEKSDYDWDTRTNTVTERLITPADLDYDEKVAARRRTMMHYNRIVFLLQGLLDRSEVFNPHPPIVLSDEAHFAEFFRDVRDEEDGLPSAHPPKWNEFLAIANAKIRPGHMVYCTYYGEKPYEGRNYYDRRDRHELSLYYDRSKRPKVCEVLRVNHKAGTVEIVWPRKREGWNKKTGEWGNWYDGMSHHKVKLDQVFNVTDYFPGDYKQFLCDPYLKGEYLEWAPSLLGAEQWHQKQRANKAKNDSKNSIPIGL
jgi:hypothetical protein